MRYSVILPCLALLSTTVASAPSWPAWGGIGPVVPSTQTYADLCRKAEPTARCLGFLSAATIDCKGGTLLSPAKLRSGDEVFSVYQVGSDVECTSSRVPNARVKVHFGQTYTGVEVQGADGIEAQLVDRDGAAPGDSAKANCVGKILYQPRTDLRVVLGDQDVTKSANCPGTNPCPNQKCPWTTAAL